MISIPIINSAIPKKTDTNTAPAKGNAITKKDKAMAKAPGRIPEKIVDYIAVRACINARLLTLSFPCNLLSICRFVCLSNCFLDFASCLTYISICRFVCLSNCFLDFASCLTYISICRFVCLSNCFLDFASCLPCSSIYCFPCLSSSFFCRLECFRCSPGNQFGCILYCLYRFTCSRGCFFNCTC